MKIPNPFCYCNYSWEEHKVGTSTTSFFCSDCGAEYTKWMGRCPNCGSWNTLKESAKITKQKGGKNSSVSLGDIEKPEALTSISEEKEDRILTGIKEFDGVLGGGIVPGMVTLIGGEPGIGKSTLMLQISEWLGQQKHKILYVSGEESKHQIRLRSQRLGIQSENVYLLCATEVEGVIQEVSEFTPDMIVIDSVQSVSLSNLESSPGSISQLRECTQIFTKLAKQSGIPVFLIGHVTKEGFVAGPKIIEHMVDTVLYFEGESQNQYKILRATKNRFGSTNEIGVFEMTNIGLHEVSNPTALFLSEEENRLGIAVGCVLEGSRAFLTEVQALVSPASYGTSQRVAIGFDQKKLSMLLAVMEKHLMLNLRASDVFLNLAGGIKATDQSLDLAVMGAIISSLKDIPIPLKAVIIGEIGLSGEIRPVSQLEKRVKEAEKMGYEWIIIPSRSKIESKSKKIHRISHVHEFYAMLKQMGNIK
ncbi:MAG TPA: DNA repair protein RadA [Candidatus Cloacimonadota bacterium]|nr:DNA repair protein RadA [Candidatus Cloacimonadota bacterium]